MKILAIWDKKTQNLKEIILKNSPDLIITLGDFDYSDLRDLEFIDIKKIWVYWNHCTKWYMQMYNIYDIHLKTLEINWLIFWWFEWCVRYKNWNHIMYTQQEAFDLIKVLPRVDILLSHCPPFWVNDNDDEPHKWFEALTKYIDDFSPKYLFHWHTYDNWKFVEKYKNTQIIYVNWYRLFEI